MLQRSPHPAKHIVLALKKIIKPLVNLLISNGITYPEFNEIVKNTFVDVADNQFKLKGKPQTDSRINFLTGIHRKDVKRIRNRTQEDGGSTTPSLSALLLSRWLGDPQYCDEGGEPLVLPRLIKAGGKISFEGMVVSINKDIRSRAILDEWISMEIVYLNDNNDVCLNKTAFVPESGYQEMAWFFGENCHDHLAAAISNLKGNKPSFLDRAVYYDQLTLGSVQELTELSEKLVMEVLININSHALDLQNKDKLLKDADYRMRLGLYFYSTEDEKAELNSIEFKKD